MWIGGGSEAAIRRTARIGTGWQGGPETPAEAARIVAAIRAATAEAGRSIDDDHYGASFPFYFGRSATRPCSARWTPTASAPAATPHAYFAIGDAGAIVARIAEYIAADVSKFVLRPVASSGEAVLAQTRQLIEQVLPLVAARWPRRPKAATVVVAGVVIRGS